MRISIYWGTANKFKCEKYRHKCQVRWRNMMCGKTRSSPPPLQRKMLSLNGRARHISRLFPPSLYEKPSTLGVPLWPFWKTWELEKKKLKVVSSLLSSGGRRPENSCLFVVFTNLEALLQTLWITAGLKHFRHSPRVIKKQVEYDEFWICDARKGTTEINYIKELVMLLYLFQLSKPFAVDWSLFPSLFELMSIFYFFFKLKTTACLFPYQLTCVSELIHLSASGQKHIG